MKYLRNVTAVVILIFVMLTSFSTQNCYINSVHGQIGEQGYFEGEVPLRGVYLQSINCHPVFGVDQNEDGVIDAGYTSDFDDDGVEETVYLEDPLIIDLTANGFYPGDMIMIGQKQSVQNIQWNQIYYSPLWGLFSSSPELYTDNWLYTPNAGNLKWPMVGPLNRVPGAIDAALGGYEHGPWDDTNVLKQGQEVENDIPEDFQIRGHIEFNEGSNGGKWTPNTWVFSNGFWIRIPPGAKYLFLQRLGYWVLNHIGYIKVTIDKDSDGDAIPDSWEKHGINFNKDNEVDLVLKDANFKHKDIYVEVDFMGPEGTCPGHNPFLMGSPLSDVQRAFANAPAESVKNPDNSAGINLHIDEEGADEISHQEVIKVFDDFDIIKKGMFGTENQRNDDNSKWILLAKKYVYHYCMFIHEIFNDNPETTILGSSEWPGNDFVVAYGGASTNPGTREELAATFMHELGHNLGLDHGGCDDINYKPNYLSVMNYLFVKNHYALNRPLDYSRVELPTLNEKALDELNGLGVNQINTYEQPWYQTVISFWENASTALEQPRLTYLMPIDYNNDDSIDPDVKHNVNCYPYWNYWSGEEETLLGWDDWANLNFYFPFSGNFADQQHPNVPETEFTWELLEQMQAA